MIFITLGSQKFQFNRLLQAVDELIEQNIIIDEVFAQIGYSDYEPKHFKYKQFLDREEFTALESKCDILITHGGTGTIINAVKKNKKVIAIPRLAKYGEHVDDHQIQLIAQFKKQNLICGLNDTTELKEGLKFAKEHNFNSYQSNTNTIIKNIEKFIEGNGKKKVLIVSNMYPDDSHPSYGIFVKRFTGELNSIGIDYSLAVMHQHDGKLKKALGYIKFYIESFVKTIFSSADYIYIHYASHSSVAVLAALSFRKRYIITNVHGSDVVPENKKQEKMQKYTKNILNMSEKIVVPSPYFQEYIKKKYNLNEKPIFIYPSGGINNSIFFPKKEQSKKAFRDLYQIGENELVFGFAGRISFSKGWDTFVKAIAQSNISARFIIVGNGNESKSLDALITELGIENKIIRIGLLPQNKLAEFYNTIDYLVFPTKGDSLGLVPIEAMACGTPVISSNFVATKYYMNDGINGFLFEMGNHEALCEIFEKCSNLNDRDYIALQQGALATAENFFASNVRKDLKKIFE